jgi:hypothetical protein
MSVCKGFNLKCTQCKRIAKNGEDYCYNHKKFEFYQGGVGWPSMSLVHKEMNAVSDHESLFKAVNYYLHAYGHRGDVFNRRMCFLLTMESVLMCPSIVLSRDDWQSLVKTLVNKCKREETGMLVRYTENFRRKVDAEYRREARNKYIHYIISISELGQDIADVVCRQVS